MDLIRTSAVLCLLGAANVPVRVELNALCIEQGELAHALKDVPNDRGGQVMVSLSAPGELRVRTVWADGQSIERKVPASAADCGAVRRVVVTLTRAWLLSPPRVLAAPLDGGKQASAREPTPRETTPRETTPRETTPRETTPRETTPRETTPRETTPSEPTPSEPTPSEPTPSEPTPSEPTPSEPIPSESAPGDTTPLEPAASEPTANTEAAAENPPTLAPTPTTGWGFGIGALGGAIAGTTSQAVGAGSFFLEATRGRLGFGLEGGLESAQSVGTAWAAQRWLTLYGRLAVPLSPRVTFATTLGIRGWQIEAAVVAFEPRSLLGGGAAVTFGLEIRLGPVFAVLRATGSARFPEERIKLNDQTVLFLRWWQVGGLAGLAWRFR